VSDEGQHSLRQFAFHRLFTKYFLLNVPGLFSEHSTFREIATELVALT